MEKAYDPKSLVTEYIAAEGLPLPELAAEALLRGLDKWVEKSVELSATSIDDMLLPGFKYLVARAKEAADKIDGQPG